jgi:16S rRNA C967 or C1407 C5-methylase (RsmB/RsmF family)/NOL1/NOP2/fmu family ribosome biogenesis protein
MKPLPPAFLERMQALLGDEFPDFVASYDQPAHIGLRVNTLKLTPEQFTGLSPFLLEPVPWCPSGFRLAGSDEARPGKHPHHAAGLYYLQEPSAMAVAEAAAPLPGQRVLDLAASPGGKSTHLASLLAGQGLLWANEIRTKRLPQLSSNLERWGVRNAVISNEPPERLADRLPGFFDVVVVDAPCSGEGMFRKEPDVRAEWDAAQIPAYAERQRLIMRFAAHLVRPGGALVYATCTFNPDENERVIASFLEHRDDFQADDLTPLPGFSPPLGASAGGSDSALACSARLWPQRCPGEGHFTARLRRVDGEAPPIQPYRPAPLPRPAEKYIQDFFAATLLPVYQSLFSDLSSPALFGDHVYTLPANLPDLRGLRVTQPGWHIGYLRKDRFEPSHAMALSLPAADFVRTLDLPATDPRLAAYLRGETLSSDGENGWLAVCVDGFPLGWGKRVKGVVKNHYPSGLRWV